MVDSTQLAGLSDPTKDIMPALSFSSSAKPTDKQIAGLPTGLSGGDLDIFGLSGDPGGSSTPAASFAPTSGTDTSSSSGFDLGSLLSGIPILGDLFKGSSQGLTGLGPYLGVGAYGLDQAKKAQKDNQTRVDQLAGLGQPYLDASKQLLQQYQSGTLRPDQQKLVDLATQEGEGLIESGSTLSAIAQQAFQDYNAGKLPQADEDRLAQQVNAQKQQVRQVLAQRGITDSSVLTSQDQAIDAQAAQTRQQLLDSRFATGNQAYNSWLNSTQAGNQLKLQGQQFASQAFEQMMSDSLGLGQEGMAPVMQSIALAVQSDNELAQTMTDLLTNLASAYAYQVASNTKSGGTAGGTGTNLFGGQAGGSNILGSILGTVGNVVGGAGKVLGDVVGGIGDIFGVDSGFGGFGDILGDIGGIFKGGGGSGGVADIFKGGGSTGGIFGENPSKAGTAGSGAGASAGIGSNLMGLYSGINEGGVAGYTNAASSAVKAASKISPSKALTSAGKTLGSAAGMAGLFEAASNFKPGQYGSNIGSGIASGAAMGSAIPGLGTAIGAAFGAFTGLLGSLGEKESKGTAFYEEYKKLPTNIQGRQIPSQIFEESLLGAWQGQDDISRKLLSSFADNMSGSDKHGGNAEQFKGWLVNTLADAYKQGKLPHGANGQQVFDAVVAPAMNEYWKENGSSMTIDQWDKSISEFDPSVAAKTDPRVGRDSGRKDPRRAVYDDAYPGKDLKRILVDLTDRALTGENIGRDASPDYAGQGYQHVPSLSEVLGGG